MVVVYKSDPKAREKPCRRCGLSLRKLFDATHCPRCGLSVWLSLNENDVLDACNPPWLATLSKGAWLMAAAQVVGLAAYCSYLMPELNRGPATAAALGTIYLLAYHGGLLLMSRHERRWPDELWLMRNVCRVLAIVGIAAGLLLPVTYLRSVRAANVPAHTEMLAAPDDDGADEPYQAATSSGSTILYEIFLGASALATFAYLRKLARRVPNHKIARVCSFILLAPVLSCIKFLPWLWYLSIAVWFMVGYLKYVPLIYLPVSIWLLVWFARTLAAAGKTAAKRWEAETVLPGPGAA